MAGVSFPKIAHEISFSRVCKINLSVALFLEIVEITNRGNQLILP